MFVRGSSGTIRLAFDPRGNAITPIRLLLALLVVFSHAYVVGRFGHDPLYDSTGGQMQLGTVAVISFFGLSGFLLARSRVSSRIGRYIKNRVLRIIPGLWACLAVTAVAVIPLAVLLGGRATTTEIGGFVLAAGALRWDVPEIPNLFPGAGNPSIVNAPLWTLTFEMLCYIGLGIVGLASLRHARLLLAALLVAFTAINLTTGGEWLYLHLPVAFLVGANLYHHGDRVPLTSVVAALLLVITSGAAVFGALAVVGPLTLPYLALWLGIRLPLRWTRDISYGTYIYAWPIQQLLAVTSLPAFGFVPYFVMTVPLVLAVAYASARLVEEPAQRLRGRGALGT